LTAAQRVSLTWGTYDYPLFVDAPSWEVPPTISAASTQPCGLNTITVSLKPTYTMRTLCCSSLTLSGLTGARAQSSTSLSIFDASAGFGADGHWNLTTTTLTVTLAADLDGATWHSFKFTVRNQAAELASTAAVLSGCGLHAYLLASGISVSGDLHLLL